jgi:hypothetical protein
MYHFSVDLNLLPQLLPLLQLQQLCSSGYRQLPARPSSSQWQQQWTTT